MKKFPLAMVTALAVCALVPSASAHTGFENVDGLISGCAHPLTGWDHVLAMVAVGLWAAHLGGRARWAVPLTFVGVLTLSALIAQAVGRVPLTEPGIAASVLALGLLIATAARVPMSVGLVLTALFASFHGFAHGAEMPATANGFAYATGFVAVTAALHILGLLSGEALARAKQRVTPAVGWVIVASGLVIAFN